MAVCVYRLPGRVVVEIIIHNNYPPYPSLLVQHPHPDFWSTFNRFSYSIIFLTAYLTTIHNNNNFPFPAEKQLALPMGPTWRCLTNVKSLAVDTPLPLLFTYIHLQLLQHPHSPAHLCVLPTDPFRVPRLELQPGRGRSDVHRRDREEVNICLFSYWQAWCDTVFLVMFQ